MNRKSLLYLLPVALFFLLVIFLARGLFLNPGMVPSPLLNKSAPEFSLPQLYEESQMVSVEEKLGKPWLLNVWASWCVACREEHEVLKQLVRYPGIDLVGLNYKDQPADAKQWLQRWGNPYTTIATDVDGRTGIDWGVYGVPETFIIDSSGIIRYKHIGPIKVKDLSETIIPLMQQMIEEHLL